MTHQVEPEAGPFAGFADRGVRQPDPGHEVPSGELGEHLRVDLVGLGRERGQALDLDRVGKARLLGLALNRISGDWDEQLL